MRRIAPPRRAGSRARRFAAPAGFALCAMLASLWHGGTPSVWYDELATASAIDRSPGELWRLLGHVDAVHGLYYYVLRTFALIFGTDPGALRAFSALGVGAAAAACVVLARRLVGENLALVSGAIALVLPRTTWAGVEARSYAWVIATAALVLISAHRAASSNRKRDWAGYGAALLLATVVFLYSATLVLAVLAVLAGTGRQRMARAAAASATAMLVGGPLLVFAFTERGQVSWLRWPGWRIFQNVLVDQWFDHSFLFAAVAWLVLVAAGVLWWRRGVTRDLGPALRWGLASALVPLAAILLVSPIAPSYVGRYVSFTVPGVVLVLTAAVIEVGRALRWPLRAPGAMPHAPRVGLAGVLAVLVAAAVPGYLWQHSPLSKPGGSDFTYAARYIHDHARPGDCVLFQVQPSWASPSLQVVFDGLPGMFDGLRDMGNDGDRRAKGKLWDTIKGVNQWASWAAENCTAAWVLADADRADDDFRRENGNLWWTFREFHFLGSDMQVSLDYGGLAVVHQEHFHVLQVVHLVRPEPAVGPDPQPLPRSQRWYW